MFTGFIRLVGRQKLVTSIIGTVETSVRRLVLAMAIWK
jgi:hypothetical protein